MTVRITQVERTCQGLTLLAEQDLPVRPTEFERAVVTPRSLGEWFGLEFSWPACLENSMEVGSSMEFVVPLGLVNCSFIMIVADRVAGESLLLRSTKGFGNLVIRCSWQAASPTGTCVQIRCTFRLKGSLWWKAPLTRRVATRKLAQGMERMRSGLIAEQIEARAVASGALPRVSRAA